MPNIGDIISKGLRSAQPAAGVRGRLYLVTDEDIIERDSGTSWEFYANATQGAANDADAFHRNVAGEILALDEKTSPADDDVVLIEDSENGGEKKKVSILNLIPVVTGGLTHEYLGYNTVGGSVETMTQFKVYAKKITLAQDGILSSIDAHIISSSSDNVASLAAALYSDNAGTPGIIISHSVGRTISMLLDSVNGAGGLAARWLALPCGAWLTAGDYWIAVQHLDVGMLNLYYDGSGNDRTYNPGASWFADWGWYSPTTTSNKYSIRANIIY